MSDERALAWRHLLPTSVRFVPAGGPEWWRELLDAISVPDGSPVPVVWGEGALHSLPGANPKSLVLINPTAETLGKFRALNLPYIRRFVVLPRLRDARLFVPLGPRQVTAAALQLYTPYRRPARVAHAGLRFAARLGVLPWRQDEVLIASSELSPVEQILQAILGGDSAALAISTGTPGPARKITIADFDRSGQIRAVCKLSTSPLACRLVANEAACLKELARCADLAPHCPRLLAEKHLEGGRIIVEEGVRGQRAGTRLSPSHHQLLSALSSGPQQPATASSLLAKLPARAREFQERGIPVLQLSEWALNTLDGLVLPRTIVHGDFAPWNLRVWRGTLMAFDWEYGQCDGLPLIDEIHHLVQVGFLVHDWSVDRVLEEVRRQAAAGSRGLSQVQIQALQAVYLVDAYLRRKEEGHPASDELLARQAEMVTRVVFSAGISAA